LGVCALQYAHATPAHASDPLVLDAIACAMSEEVVRLGTGARDPH